MVRKPAEKVVRRPATERAMRARSKPSSTPPIEAEPMNAISETENETPMVSHEAATDHQGEDTAAFSVEAVLSKARALKAAGQALVADIEAAISVKTAELRELTELRASLLGEAIPSPVEAFHALRQPRAYVISDEPRAPRGSGNETVLTVLSETHTGMTRGELLKRLQITSDKKQSAKISNALVVLKKSGKIVQNAETKKYALAPA